ncbi:MAG TPA: STAS domain-containing protein [Caulobacteraceae bacterium]|nr:STAS domain-containing protein [Caulobacteraceae bacterium]
MSASLTLGPVLDLRAAGALRADLLEKRGQAMVLDASGVERMGGLCLQVLLAAQAAWAEDGLPFTIASPSEGFREAVRLLGAGERLANLETGGAP